MADKSEPERSGQQKPVAAGSSGAVEWSSNVSSDSPLNVEWTAVLGGLPDLSPEAAVAFYDRASRALPATRIRGFYGACDGSDERSDDVVLFLYKDDPQRPVVKLVMTRADILRFAEALGDLVERFRP
jgi:hypothetical protein